MNLAQFLNKNKTANSQSIPQDTEDKAVENDVVYIPHSKLRMLPNNPFNMYEGEKFDELVESIKENGVLVPVIVCPADDGTDTYYKIDGNHRDRASTIAGYEEVPCIIKNISVDEAIVCAIDTNSVRRETLLPSEKAWAYRFKMEALKRQGKRTDLTLSQFETKLNSGTELAKESEDSRAQIYKYIRLTELCPALLKMVDEGTIPISVGVELSYISITPQELVADVLSGEKGYSIDIKKAEKLRELDGGKYLTLQKITQILKVQKLEKDPKTTKPSAQIRKYFPSGTKAREIEKILIELLEKYYKGDDKQSVAKPPLNDVE